MNVFKHNKKSGFTHQKIRNFSGGFTLIELLVVIAIISLLSSVILASLNGARVKARDAQRKTTLRQLANANELLRDTGSYSSSAGWLSNWTPNSNPFSPTYISTISTDPGGNGGLGYMYWRKDFTGYGCLLGGQDQLYGFYARLENPSASDLATISDSFDICVRNTWSMNYKVGN